MPSKDDVLIIEDSPAICMLLKNYLEKLGYAQIHICTNGSTAIETFKELVNMKKQPIVLLDYMLPDMDARSILTQMLEVQPNARVVLETATEKDDEGIKELIRLGVYQYLEKPIRFENLKFIFETIEKEQSFFTKESEQIKIIEESKQQAETELHVRIDFILKSAKQISLNLIEQYLNFSDETVTLYLNELEKQGKITTLVDKKEIACNQCDSVKTTQTYSCPTCKKSDFKRAKLIEHFGCGNFSDEKTYVDSKCPKCNKEIKAVGVDYKIISSRYVCNSCNDIFTELLITFLCLKCESRFTLDDAKWKTSPHYKVIQL